MASKDDPRKQGIGSGNDVSEVAANSLLKKLGWRLEQLDRWVDDPPDGETFITRIAFNINAGYKGDVFCIVNAIIGGEKRVAFHGEETLAEAVVGVVNRLNNGSMTWKEDKPYGQRKDDGGANGTGDGG